MSPCPALQIRHTTLFKVSSARRGGFFILWTICLLNRYEKGVPFKSSLPYQCIYSNTLCSWYRTELPISWIFGYNTPGKNIHSFQELFSCHNNSNNNNMPTMTCWQYSLTKQRPGQRRPGCIKRALEMMKSFDWQQGW